MKSYMSVVANILNKKKPETILDTPSGSGWLLSLLSYDPEIDGIDLFEEKPKGDGALINGGYFVLSPKVIERIERDDTIWEQEPLKSLATDGELMSFKHNGFWHPLDTLRDKIKLNELLDQNKAPWKVWK